MSGVLHRIRAAAFVALAFGIAWGTIVWLALFTAAFVTSGLEVLLLGRLLLLWYLVWVSVGVLQGVLVASAMALTGGRWTVDSFPRWLGALFGSAVGMLGLFGLRSLAGLYSPTVGGAITMMALVCTFGSASTLLLLTIARRGALPPPPAQPEQLGS